MTLPLKLNPPSSFDVKLMAVVDFANNLFCCDKRGESSNKSPTLPLLFFRSMNWTNKNKHNCVSVIVLFFTTLTKQLPL